MHVLAHARVQQHPLSPGNKFLLTLLAKGTLAILVTGLRSSISYWNSFHQ
jgi:hypothetical protein